MKEHSLHSSNCPRLNFLMKFSVLSKMQNVTEQISKSAGKLFLFATSPFCFTSAPAQLPAVSNGSIGGLSGPSFSLTGGAQINMKGARTISPPFSLVCFTGTGRTHRTQSQAHPAGAQPQWREFPRLTSAPFSSRSFIIEWCCSITWEERCLQGLFTCNVCV